MFGNLAVGIAKQRMTAEIPHLPIKHIFSAPLIVNEPLFNHIFMPFVKARRCMVKLRA
jgi:hypothetical protein